MKYIIEINKKKLIILKDKLKRKKEVLYYNL